MAPYHPPETSAFNKSQHVKYWLRCLKTYLPTLYQSNDSSRMTLAFFTLSSLDLLDALTTHTTALERKEYVDWIYQCQHPNGGFRGFTGTNFGSSRNEHNACWDPANLAATYFALAALMILEDDLERVRVSECLSWLRQLQQDDGSFGEGITVKGRVVGGKDVRFCYCAAAIRWIMRQTGRYAAKGNEEDVNIKNLARFIISVQTFEGGLGNSPFHEAHAGWTYCGIGTLSLLDKLPAQFRDRHDQSVSEIEIEMSNFIASLIHWLVSRQTSTVQAMGNFGIPGEEASETATQAAPNLFNVQGAVVPSSESLHLPTPLLQQGGLYWAGFSGRCNKEPDTCYSFWTGGALAMLNAIHLIDFNANRRHLLEKTQHMIGGFGKLPGDPPDIMHSYLGLASLAAMREPQLKSLDPALCVSVSVREAYQARTRPSQIPEM